jgi:choline dehydrogenase-like flavoprotein
MAAQHDVIVIGSGAGGGSVAYKLAKAGKRVLLIEKGPFLPRDKSTLEVRQVFVDGVFKNHVVWLDSKGKDFVPGEFYNVGGKTKWYGAALFRFRPVEFEAEADYGLLAWPFGYDELKPYYDEATDILRITTFDNEPQLQKLLDKITTDDPKWELHQLPLGLSHDIVNHPEEAKHFDGFASPSGLKSDSERNLIDEIRDKPNFTLLAGDPVAELVAAPGDPCTIVGVKLADGSTHEADTIVLAAGAMTSPRILEDHLHANGIKLPCGDLVGANFKMHINSAVLGFSPFKDHDVLRKTAVLYNEKYPHSSMQCLGWIDPELLAVQAPSWTPSIVDKFLGTRAIGFWATTEDASTPENRIISGGPGGKPIMDYSLDRIPHAVKEHHAMIDDWLERMLGAGLAGAEKYMGMGGTAHAVGSLVTGADPKTSVVDPHGKVYGMENLYVGDGSPLPRVSRVNPSLTIYAWGLRLGEHLAGKSA